MADLGQVGTGSATSAGLTLAITNTTGAIIPAGTVLVLAMEWDNINSITAPVVSASASGGSSWVARLAPVGSGVTTTAGSGIWHASWSVRTVSNIASGATITTVTSNQSAVKRVGTISGFSDCTNTIRATVLSGVSGVGTPSVVTTGTALEVGDVVVGTSAVENNAIATGDPDTLNGSWTGITGVFTTGAGAATNLGVGIQSKTVTATGAQTYNITTASTDSIVSVFALIPSTRAVADSAPATDAETHTWSAARAAADDAPATDAVTYVRNQPRATADSAPAADAVVRSFALPRAAADSAPATDIVARTLLLPRAPTDSASATDSVVSTSVRFRSVADSAPASDTVDADLDAAASIDARVAWVEFVVPEPISISEVSDSAPAVDTVTRTLAASRSVSDSAPATDTVVRTVSRTRAVADSAPAVDTVARSLVQTRSAADSAPATDATTYFRTFPRSVADSAPATDATTRALQLSRSVADSAPATDAVVRVYTPVAGFIEVFVDDSAPATDTLARSLAQSRAPPDTAPADDSVTRAVMLVRDVSDSAPADDAALPADDYQRRQYVGVRAI